MRDDFAEDLAYSVAGISNFVERIHREQPELRDYFAAAALPGLSGEFWACNPHDKDVERVARNAYRIADAMLAAREKGVAS